MGVDTKKIKMSEDLRRKALLKGLEKFGYDTVNLAGDFAKKMNIVTGSLDLTYCITSCTGVIDRVESFIRKKLRQKQYIDRHFDAFLRWLTGNLLGKPR